MKLEIDVQSKWAISCVSLAQANSSGTLPFAFAAAAAEMRRSDDLIAIGILLTDL